MAHSTSFHRQPKSSTSNSIISIIGLIFIVYTVTDTLDTIANQLDRLATTTESSSNGGDRRSSGSRPKVDNPRGSVGTPPLPPPPPPMSYSSASSLLSSCIGDSIRQETLRLDAHTLLNKHNHRYAASCERLINGTLNQHNDNGVINKPPEDKEAGWLASWSPNLCRLLNLLPGLLNGIAKQQSGPVVESDGWFPLIKQVDAIRLLRLDAPQSVQAGQPIRLRCLYEIKGDKLQSLSWYKNGREFYRYQPFERRQPVLAFNLTGVYVDITRSRNNTVVLTNTTSETSGRYKCEATGNTFQEVNLETYVNVVTAASGAISVVSVVTILPHLLASITFILFLIK